MRILLITLFTSFLFSSISWETDFARAKETAAKDHKLILLNFSGSDWCGPCIRMEREIFETTSFNQFAHANLVLLKADFPRLKKNQLSKEQQSKNDHLADLYNKEGKFPLTLLVTPEGKVLKSWDGLPHLSPEEFVNEVKAGVNAHD